MFGHGFFGSGFFGPGYFGPADSVTPTPTPEAETELITGYPGLPRAPRRHIPVTYRPPEHITGELRAKLSLRHRLQADAEVTGMVRGALRADLAAWRLLEAVPGDVEGWLLGHLDAGLGVSLPLQAAPVTMPIDGELDARLARDLRLDAVASVENERELLLLLLLGGD